MSKMIKKSLHEILHEPISGSRPKGGVSLEGDIPSLGGENITMSGEISFYPVKKITTEFFESMKRGHLRNLDVLINKDGANTGKSSIYRNSPYPKATINEHLFILRGIEDKLDQEYLHYLIQSSSVKKILETKITGSAQPGLNSTFVQNFPVEITSLPEQKKIASILNSVDDVIEKTQSQINKSQDLKKGTMNELLTKGVGHTEFKDSELGRIPKNWDVFCIDDIAFVTKLAGFEYSEYFDYSIGGDIITIRALNLKNGKLDLKEVQTISKSVSDKLPRSKLKKGDLVISYVGTVGEVALIEKSEKFHLAPNVAKITPNQEKVLSEFLLHNLISDKTKKLIMLLGTITSQPSINMGNIRKILISLPPIKEQRKICNIFSSIDNFIEVKIKKLKKYKSLKKSLMQDLLTGKVRVKVN